MKISSHSNQSQKDPLLIQFWEKNDFSLDSVNFKLRNNNIILYISGNLPETTKIMNNSEYQKENRISFTAIIEKNLQTSKNKYLFSDVKTFSPDIKIHHLIPNPRENSIDFIFSNSNLIYVQFTNTSIFREEFILRKNRMFKKILWNRLHTNQLIGLNIDNTIELIDIEKLNEEIFFNMGDETIRDVIHLERGTLYDMLMISGEDNLYLYDPRRRNKHETFYIKENLTQLNLSERNDTEIIGYDEKTNSTLIFDLKKCNVPVKAIDHQNRKLKKQIWSKDSLYFLFEEDSCLNYQVFGKDAYIPYDTSLSYNIIEESVIDDFHIIPDEMNNIKCMIVTKNHLKMIDTDY